MMESIGDTYDDASEAAGEVNNVQTGGAGGDRTQSGGAGTQSRLPGGPEAVEATDDDGSRAAAPIFEAVERELDGGPPLPT